jgi:hypothetical protein
MSLQIHIFTNSFDLRQKASEAGYSVTDENPLLKRRESTREHLIENPQRNDCRASGTKFRQVEVGSGRCGASYANSARLLACFAWGIHLGRR